MHVTIQAKSYPIKGKSQDKPDPVLWKVSYNNSQILSYKRPVTSQATPCPTKYQSHNPHPVLWKVSHNNRHILFCKRPVTTQAKFCSIKCQSQHKSCWSWPIKYQSEHKPDPVLQKASHNTSQIVFYKMPVTTQARSCSRKGQSQHQPDHVL